MRFKITTENLEEVTNLIRQYQIDGHLEILIGGHQIDFVVDRMTRRGYFNR